MNGNAVTIDLETAVVRGATIRIPAAGSRLRPAGHRPPTRAVRTGRGGAR
jgi:hypothetical protein